MDFDEIVDKGKKAVKDGTDKIEEVRTSAKAEEVRDGIVEGFGKLMKAVLPGTPKEQAAQRQLEGGEPLTPEAPETNPPAEN